MAKVLPCDCAIRSPFLRRKQDAVGKRKKDESGDGFCGVSKEREGPAHGERSVGEEETVKGPHGQPTQLGRKAIGRRTVKDAEDTLEGHF